MSNNKIVGLGSQRQSNIEALRLLSMLMVLNLHSFYGFEYGNGVLQAVDFFRETTSICAVDVFILISGYFGIRWKIKSFWNLVFQVFFYSFVVYGVAVFLGAIEFNRKDFGECFKALYKSWPFVSCYIALYFISPLLNVFAEKSEDKTILFYIIILFLAENFIMHVPGTNIFNFSLIYLVGRFLHKTEAPEKLKINAINAYSLTTIIIFLIVYSLFVLFHFDGDTMSRLVIGYNYSSPLIILQAIFLFMIFSRINIKSNAINWCASSCLAVFLIHWHPAIFEIGYKGYAKSLYQAPFVEHVIYLFLLIIGVFGGAILVDKIRMFISNILYSILCYFYSMIPFPIKNTCMKIWNKTLLNFN